MQVTSKRIDLGSRAGSPAVDHIGDVLASVAHELRNPLATISYAVDSLGHGSDHNDVMVPRAMALMLQRQVGYLTRIVEGLLDGAQLSHGTLRLDRSDVDLNTVIKEGIENCERLILERGHQVDLRLPQDALAVAGDRIRLVQVMTNLITNAAKYTPAGGRLQVALERVNDSVTIEVIDSGVGLLPEQLERIFDSYWQATPARRGGASGIGLGLTLVRQWVELHGGTVSARSEGAGKGATFTVRLPLGG